VKKSTRYLKSSKTSMNTEIHSKITVQGLEVEIVRKEIKNLHLSVNPPNGQVRVSAPLRLNDEAVRLAIIERLVWIHRHKKRFEDQLRQSQREFVSGESHYFQGRRYLLRVKERVAPPAVRLVNNTTLELVVRPGTGREKREEILNFWYRRQLREQIPPLIEKWEQKMTVSVEDWGIKRMKTRWGTCNRQAKRIWVNLELAKKAPLCLEYIVVHEMTHLLERNHTVRFTSLMEQFMPLWREYRDELNRSILGKEKWRY